MSQQNVNEDSGSEEEHSHDNSYETEDEELYTQEDCEMYDSEIEHPPPESPPPSPPEEEVEPFLQFESHIDFNTIEYDPIGSLNNISS